MVLKNFKRDKLKALMEDAELNSLFALNFFPDQDNYNFFYIQFLKDMEKNMDVLYKFSLDGKLIEVLYIKHKEKNIYTRFHFKKNNVFYAKEKENIVLYKEEKNEK